MPFDPVRDAAHAGHRPSESASPPSLFTPIPIPIPPSPSIKKGSLANILNDDPALDPSLRSPEARLRSSPAFEFPPRSSSSSLSHPPFFSSPSMAPTLTQTASPVLDAAASRPSSAGLSLPPQTAFALASPPPPRQPSPTLYVPMSLKPNAPPLLPMTPRDVALFSRSRNWLRKGVDRTGLPPPSALPLPPTAPFSDANGIGYYLPPPSPRDQPAEAIDSGTYSPSGPAPAARDYSPSRPISGKRAREDDELTTPPPKRRAPSAPGDDIAAVAGHYNARPDVGRTARRESPIIGLKNFNNWVKSVVIQKFGRNGHDGTQVRVLDMGCGKGGDLQKWTKNSIREYVGLDVAAVSVDQARQRWLDMRGKRFQASFHALDCYRDSIRNALSPRQLAAPFQTVSMQFCMHYAFFSEDSVRQMLDNVSTNLESGGTFIGTIPNAEHILANLAASDELAFGNPVFRITFPQLPPSPPSPDDPDQSGAFGHKYFFFLQDAVGDDDQGVPEYLVHWPNFVRLAAEYGLEPEYRKDFADLLEEEREHPVYGPLLRRMKVVDVDGESDMDQEQWEAASIYLAFAFRKA